MGKHLGHELSAELLEKLASGAFYRAGGLALPVLTIDEAGWPHVAMAPGAVAADPRRVWFALGTKTKSVANLERDPRVTLIVAGPDTLYYVKGRAELVRREMHSLAQEAAIRLDVSEVIEDMEPFLTITGGFSYRYNLMHDDAVLIIGAMLDELRALAEED